MGPGTRRVQASNEFELDGQRVVLIDTPGIANNTYLEGTVICETLIELIKEFLAESYVKT